ncbi:hypothetical protein O181_017641 [Austropuccinia psidii MF-1]|uniref:1-phosphatidylinositol-3-phosphate 5-kinase n=1 Tax=Austropuccinia psidii MF-1 TaxID=1389203 RepID=A0A9Q3GS59_9BASI|nr:hypothetical protein [Austropuccinia psidii MF-1]
MQVIGFSSAEKSSQSSALAQSPTDAASPAPLTPDSSTNHSSYVSFPETIAPSTLRPHTSQSSLGIDSDKTFRQEARVPKTLLGRLKSAIGASAWISPATTSEHKTSTIALSTRPALHPPITTSYSHVESEGAKDFNLSNSSNKLYCLSPSSGRLRVGGFGSNQSSQIELLSSSGLHQGPLQSSVSSHLSSTPRSSHAHHLSLDIPSRPGSSSSYKNSTPLFSGHPPVHRRFPTTPDSIRAAPFHFHPHSENDDTFPLTSSDTLLRSLALSNAVGDHSPDLSIVPAFSHIPGFPLGRETVGDDSGSVLSSSFGRSPTFKRSKRHLDSYQSRVRENLNPKKSMGRIQGKGLSKEYWMPDKDAKECYDCAAVFTSWRRKHHCRICGAIFCSRCASNLVSGHRFACSGYIRVCNICLAKLEPESDEPTNFTGREDTDDETSFSDPTSGFQLFGSRSRMSRPQLSTHGKQRETNKLSKEQPLLNNHQRSGRPMYLSAKDQSSGRHRSELRQLATPDRVKSKLSYLTNSPPTLQTVSSNLGSASSPSVTRKVTHSRSTMSNAPFRKGLSDEEQNGLPSIKVLSHHHSSLLSSSSASKLDTDITPFYSIRTYNGSTPEYISREASAEVNTINRTFDAPPSATLRKPQKTLAEAQHQRDLGFTQKLSKITSAGWSSEAEQNNLQDLCLGLPASTCEHIGLMIHQFLTRESVVKAPIWQAQLTKLLLQLASDPPRPTSDGEDAADIRQLTKIKKIPGGQITDCEYIHGVVFTKNVVHKKMKTFCVNPRVLATSIPLEFQRVDGYSKLEPLIRQERQYLKTLVQRLTCLKPDLLLVEGNVSGLAIEYLVDAGVTVLRHVKPTVLQAVARSTQTPLISSLDKLLNLKVGHCGLFNIQTLQHRMIPGNHRKTLTRVEGCEPSLGATILLRGGDLALLTKLKALMSMMVRIVYSLRLEQAFFNGVTAVNLNSFTQDSSSEEAKNTDIRCILSRFRRARRQLGNMSLLPKQMSKLQCKVDMPVTPLESTPLSDQIDDILKPYEVLSLSGTPFVKLTPPYALLKFRQLDKHASSLRQSFTKSSQSSAPTLNLSENPKNELILQGNESIASFNPPGKTESVDGSSLKSANTTARPSLPALPAESAHAEYLAELARRVEEERLAVFFYLSNHRTETFCAVDHQSIIVQETVTCPPLIAASPGYTCEGPHLRAFSFYSAGDQSVGKIIQMMIACHSQPCPAKGCNQPKNVHHTNWIHGGLKATIHIHHSMQSGHSRTNSMSGDSDPISHSSDLQDEVSSQNLIMLQGYCRLCDSYSLKTPMSDDAWRLSLGKYLQLCFYAPGLIPDLFRRESSEGQARCPHDSMSDHARFFFYQGFQIEFQLQKINVYEAVPPPMVLMTPSQAQTKVREDEYKIILKRSEAFFNSVRNRIIGFNYDVVSNDKQDASEEAMRELLKNVDIDAQAVKSQLDEVYEDCMGTHGVRMNIVRKTLIAKAVEWDQRFTAFESRFVAGDPKEARRLTSVPLKKIFMDQASVPGSPDKLFPRLNHFPTLNAAKYQYNSQSEIDSDHAPKASVSGSFKNSFPSPTLKSMANALAFALPSSMPGRGITDARVQFPSEKQKNGLALQIDSSCISQSSEPARPKDEALSDLHSNSSTALGELDPDSKLQSERSVELPIPSVLIEASTSVSVPAPISVSSESLNMIASNEGEGAAKELETPADSVDFSSIKTIIPIRAGSKPSSQSALTLSDIHPSSAQVESGSDQHLEPNQEENDQSDSTVVNVRSSRGSEPRGKKRAESDTDTTTTSEIELRNDNRRLTLRGRRVKDLVLNTRGGVANLVQKFEIPVAAGRKGIGSNHSTFHEPPADIELTNKPIKTLAVRPSLRRGKSEIGRSTSTVMRGKRPVGLVDKGLIHDDHSQSAHSSSHRVSDKGPSMDLLSHVGLKVVSRNQHKLGTRIASPKRLHDTLHLHRAHMSRLGSHGSELALEKPVSYRVPRFNKDFSVLRRSRPDSGLPVPSFLIQRHANLPSQNKVTTIARHFDRINREAERERLKQANEHRSRPRPIAQAKSSVQAFSSLTAAVNEDSDSDVDECEGHPAGHDADDEGDVLPDIYRPETSAEGVPNLNKHPATDRLVLGHEVITPVPPHPSPDLEHHDTNHDSKSLQSNPELHPPPSPSFLTESFRLPPAGVSQFSDNDMSSSDTGRHSIIKTLSNLWSYRGADFLPLEYPQLPTEHQSEETPVIIREDEPSSIIAYTLASKLYQDTLKETEPRVVEQSEVFMPEEFKNRNSDIDSTWGMIDFTSGELDVDDVFKVPMNSAKPMQFRYDVVPCTITCKVFFMHQFEVLRKTLLCKDIVESLARCHKWDASGGKSGQKFLKTKDERYLIKGISKAELEALTKFAPAYFEYLLSARKEKRPVTLAKMLGIFQISFFNKSTNRKGRLQVQVIENLWVTKPHLQIYDLKGLTRNRTVNSTGRPHEVLLDGNFCEMIRTNPVFIHENSLLRLQASLHNDTLFLASNNVMDYSLAVGFDEEKKEMYVGIIDYLQTYSWDKRLETLVKELGGTSKEAPTVITPSLYKARFRRAMGRYFTVMPDAWMNRWKPYLSTSEDDYSGGATALDKDNVKLTETNGKTEDCYIHFSG